MSGSQKKRDIDVICCIALQAQVQNRMSRPGSTKDSRDEDALVEDAASGFYVDFGRGDATVRLSDLRPFARAA
jgi:hypothetical protein